MSSIRTYNDLLEEKKRLEALLVTQKGAVLRDLIELREEFRPALNLISTVGKLTSRNGSNPLISMGVNLVGGLAGGLLLENVILSRGAKIARAVVPFLATKLSGFLNKKGGTIFQKLAGAWKKNKSNGHTIE